MKVYHADLTDKEKAASKRGRRSVNKGKVFEREMVRLFRECLPECFTVQRMLQARGGGGLPDVEIRLDGDPYIHAECKHGKKPNIRKAMEQAWHDAHNGTIAVAITRADRDNTLVTLMVDDFIRILKGLSYLKETTEETK